MPLHGQPVTIQLGAHNDNPANISYSAIGETGHRVLVDDAAPLLAVYRSPGMHQVFDEPDELALTPQDREFLIKLGIGGDLQKMRRFRPLGFIPHIDAALVVIGAACQSPARNWHS